MRPHSFISNLRYNDFKVGTFHSCNFDRLSQLHATTPIDVGVVNDPIFHLFWSIAGLWNISLATVFWDIISKPQGLQSMAIRNETIAVNKEQLATPAVVPSMTAIPEYVTREAVLIFGVLYVLTGMYWGAMRPIALVGAALKFKLFVDHFVAIIATTLAQPQPRPATPQLSTPPQSSPQPPPLPQTPLNKALSSTLTMLVGMMTPLSYVLIGDVLWAAGFVFLFVIQ